MAKHGKKKKVAKVQVTGIVGEESSLSNVLRKRKYFRFHIFETNKKVPAVSSARYSEEDRARTGLEQYLAGDQTSLFGDLGKYGIIQSSRMF